MEASTPPKRAAPTNLSARLRETVPLASPRASSSKECSSVMSSWLLYASRGRSSSTMVLPFTSGCRKESCLSQRNHASSHLGLGRCCPLYSAVAEKGSSRKPICSPANRYALTPEQRSLCALRGVVGNTTCSAVG